MPRRFPDAFKELGDAYGGIENFHAERASISQEAQTAWNTDVLSVGVILRSHLFVEYYLNKYLTEKQKLSFEKIDKLTFYKKIKRVENENDASIAPMLPFIEHLNRIRNNMAHNLNYQISKEELNFFKGDADFLSYYELARFQIEENDPMHIYEIYSQFIAQRLNAALNAKQHLIDNVMQAISQDAVDVYFGQK